MIHGKHILAICPARGGSKGLHKKNIRPLANVPLVAHVGALVGQLPELDKAVISTDDEDIARIGQEAGLKFQGWRPAELAGDVVSDWPVLHHELLIAEQLDGITYDVVVMLQATSPLRRPAHVRASIEKLIHESLDAVWTVSPTDSKHHPLKQLTLDAVGTLDYYDPQGAQIIARQQLSPLYHRNGAAYAFTRQCIMEQRAIKGARTGAVVVTEPMISIDTALDFGLCEFLLSMRDQPAIS